MTNPLVAPVQSSTTGYSGVPLLESANDLRSSLEQGDWAGAAMGAVGTALDALSMAMDPFGAILAAGVGWLLEHVGPLKEALDGLTGNADEVASRAETWRNVGKELESVANDLKQAVREDLSGWTGQAADAYRRRADDIAALISAAQQGSTGAASGVETAGTVVGAVRTTVRDIIAELVGHLISWALQVLFTLGIGMTWVVPQVVSAVAKTASKIADLVKRLVQAMKNLVPLMKRAGDLFDDAASALKGLRKADGPAPHGGSPGGGTHASSADTPRGGPNGAHGGSPDAPGSGKPGDVDVPGANGGTGPSGSRGGPNGRGDSPGVKDNIENPKTDSREPKCVPGSGDPVDLATGQMFTVQVDVELPGSLPLVLGRTHFSGYRAGRSFGGSWASTVDQRVEVDGDGVYFADDQGARLAYPRPGADGSPVYAEEGPRWPLAQVPGALAVHNPERGTTLYFTGEGSTRPLSLIVDRNGDSIAFDRDEQGMATLVRHSSGRQIAVSVEGGRTTGYALRTAGAQDVALQRFRYDDAGRLAEVTNSAGLSTSYEYDARGRVTSWRDRNGEWYRYGYDQHGRVVEATGSGGALAGRWEYDRDSRVTRYTNSLGHTTEHHFNERWQVERVVDAAGGQRTQSWTRYDQLLSTTDGTGATTGYRYDDAGNLTEVVDADGGRTIAEYNELGLPVTIVDRDGGIWRHTYDPRGNLLDSTAPDGAVVRRERDASGRLVAETDQLGNTTRVVCDQAGLPVLVTDPDGATHQHLRDRFGRVVEYIDPAGGHTRYGWTVEGKPQWRTDPDGATHRWVYDAEGNEIEHVAPGGARTRREIGHFDLPTVRITPDGARHELGYDTELRLVTVTNPAGQVWRYDYDTAGNLAAETDFAGRTTRWEHDAAGRPVQLTDAAGRMVRYTYDQLGNVVRKSTADGDTSYTYDAMGNLVGAGNADATLAIERDARGRVVAETVNGRTVRSAYDRAGRRIQRSTPSGVDSRWEYDSAHRAVALHTAGHTLSFGRDALGREVERRTDAGALLRQAWDAGGKLTAQELSAAQRRSYAYGAAGALERIDDTLRGSRSYGRDGGGRVVTADAPGVREHYVYGPLGDLDDAAWTGQATQPIDGPRVAHGTRNVHYAHDAAGRVLRRTRKRLSRPAETWHYEWDGDGRLAGVRTPDGARWRYRYDPLGRRIAKERLAGDGTVAQRTDFVWDGTTLAEAWHADGSVTAWEYEADGFTPLTQTRTAAGARPSLHTVVTDQVGTPTELVAPDGTVIWQARTTVWGVPLAEERAACPLRFAGQYADEETGLHQNYARYYDPETASYLSQDPLGLDPAPNPRTYVADPLRARDPLGLAPDCDVKDLYHGTKPQNADIIRNNGIDPHISKRPMDFGSGFYTTTDPVQAQKWADRLAGGPGKGEVLHYKVPQSELDKLNTKTFPEANQEWRDFCNANRAKGAAPHSYESVSGPMVGNVKDLQTGGSGRPWGQQTTFHSDEAAKMLGQYLQPAKGGN